MVCNGTTHSRRHECKVSSAHAAPEGPQKSTWLIVLFLLAHSVGFPAGGASTSSLKRSVWLVPLWVLPVCFNLHNKKYLVDGQRIHFTHCLTCIDRTGKGIPLRLLPSSGRRSWSGQQRGGSAATSSQTRLKYWTPNSVRKTQP